MQNTSDDPTPPQADRLQWLTAYLSHRTGRAITPDEVIAMAVAEMADRAMTAILQRVFGSRATGRRPELALMITSGEC